MPANAAKRKCRASAVAAYAAQGQRQGSRRTRKQRLPARAGQPFLFCPGVRAWRCCGCGLVILAGRQGRARKAGFSRRAGSKRKSAARARQRHMAMEFCSLQGSRLVKRGLAAGDPMRADLCRAEAAQGREPPCGERCGRLPFIKAERIHAPVSDIPGQNARRQALNDPAGALKRIFVLRLTT